MSDFEQLVQQANNKFNNKFIYDLDSFKGVSKKLNIECPKHGKTQQKIKDHIRSRHGCNKCRYENTNSTKTLEQVIKEFKSVHGDRYNYKKVEYTSSRVKVSIICKEHGEFQQLANSHIKGTGCPKCSGRCDPASIIDKCIETHGDKYLYDKSVYIEHNKKILITCKEHGDFWQLAYNHIKGTGCPECTRLARRLDFQEFQDRSNRIHNFKYDYSCTVLDPYEKISIECPNHGFFKTLQSNHLKGSGCPKCFALENKRLFSPETYRNRQTLLYYIKIKGVYKIGITLKNIESRYKRESIEYEVIGEWLFEDGYEAASIEKEVLLETIEYKVLNGEEYLKYGGKTELRNKNIIEIIERKINERN